MKKLYNIIFTIILISSFSFAQNNRLHGVIIGESSLKNVNIIIKGIDLSTTSDNNGDYQIINIPEGNFTILFSHIGYKQKKKTISIKKNQELQLDVTLERSLILLGEAKVVSSRTDHIIKDLSLPLEYVNKTKLNNTTSLTISGLLNNESGVTVIKDGPWATAVNVRGLSKQNLVYLIDGNRIETSTNIAAGLSLIDLNDIESVEIVKGGLSSLYGTGATGGVINIRSKEANFNERSFYSSQFISGFNSVNNSNSNYLNLAAGDNNWSAKVTGSYRKADDTKTPNGNLQNSSFQDESLNASFKYSPIDKLILKIDYQKFSAFDVGIPGGSPFPKSATAKYRYAKRDMFSAAIHYDNVSQYLIKTSLKYYHQVIGRSVELKPNPKVIVNPSADHTTNGLTFQSDWYLASNNYLVGGIDYWQREYHGIRKVNNKIKDIISVDKPVPNSKFRSLGLFAQDELKLDDNFSVSISGRYDFINITNEKTKNPLYISNAGVRNENVRNQLASFDSYDANNKSVSGSIGTVYKFLPDYDFVLNLGYNFRSPSLEERYQFIDLGGIVYLGNPELKPERGLYFDTGVRVWKEDLSLKISAFYNSFTNLVIDDVLYPDSIFVKNNVGEARLYGFDGSVDYNFYEDYLLYANIAYVKGDDLTKNSNLAQIPPFKGIIGVKVPIRNLLNIDFSTTFTANQEKIGLGERRTGGYAYYDMSILSNPIKFSYINLKIIAGIQNIFNREYREHLSTYRGINMFEPGRNIFVKLILNIE